MHDIRYIRENPEAFDAALKRRGIEDASMSILEADTLHRAVLGAVQQAQADSNAIAKQIGKAMAQGDHETANRLKAEAQALKNAPSTTAETEAALGELLAGLPNLPAPEVPDGTDESGNVVVQTHGVIPTFDFTPQEHADFGPALGLDFESAQIVSGARFAYLRGQMARLSRALGQFMLDVQTTEFGFQEVAPPLLVRDEAAFGTGQLPKLADDMFRTTDGRWLIPTAEVSLTNLVREKLLSEAELPLRFTALTPCFRMEAGAAGRDTRGLIRQHQFDKVELVSITTPNQSEAEHERMTSAAETILDRLELPYRRMLLCAGDMGFTARKTYDLEVWLPGQQAYREISSCSNCG
ncbi:MAG: serine--tRNA ligase, partial [Sphingomonadales bacterium]|nr:serine--tRNA ligase [Sphingomonadales bacterium]